jgi:molecular chaperone GrpE
MKTDFTRKTPEKPAKAGTPNVRSPGFSRFWRTHAFMNWPWVKVDSQRGGLKTCGLCGICLLMDNDVKYSEADERDSDAPTAVANTPVAPGVAPKEIEELISRAAKADDNWDRFVRLTADFDNYKKRAARERQEAISFANENLLSRLVPVLDAFEMAMAAASNDAAAKSLQAGVLMISNQLKSVLAEAGLEEIEAGGKPFDPNLHEAVTQQETTEAPEGHVIRQIRKGYKFRNRLLRPAGVVVAKTPAA